MLDVALLIETGVKYEVEKIIVLFAEKEQQIQRLIDRDGLLRGEAEKRVSTQMDITEKLEYADYVIDNSGSKDRTIAQARALYNELEGLKNIKKGT